MAQLFWYGKHTIEYLIQMMPCVFLALVLFCLTMQVRKKRLQGRGCVSSAGREALLLLFTVFCAGLIALTMFPAGFWPYVIEYVLDPTAWREGPELALFYPGWEEILAETDYRNLYKPFQEIYRGLTAGPWVFFLLLGNIIMFIPIGLLPAFLWRGPRWWKAFLYGLTASAAIEFVQLFIGRSTDIDDILLNVFGAMIGYWGFCLIRFFAPDICAGFYCYERGEDETWSI